MQSERNCQEGGDHPMSPHHHHEDLPLGLTPGMEPSDSPLILETGERPDCHAANSISTAYEWLRLAKWNASAGPHLICIGCPRAMADQLILTSHA